MIIENFSNLIRRQKQKYGNREAFRHKDPHTKNWISTSWETFALQVKNIAKAMVEMGVNEQENMATYTQNRPEGLIADFAAYSNRAVMVPLYATSSEAQIEYIIKEAEIRFLFVGEQFQYDNARAVQKRFPVLEKLIILDSEVKKDDEDTTSVYFSEMMALGERSQRDDVVEERSGKVTDSDLCNIIYTSGTTGEPKGVMLTHGNYRQAMRIHIDRLNMVSDKDLSMCFLPLTHVFERAWTYFCLESGIRVAINFDPKEIQKTIREVQPTIMCSVPRFWEKVYTAVQEKIAQAKGIQKVMMSAALEVGRKRNLSYARTGRKAPLWTELKYKFFDKVVFTRLRAAIGIPKGNIFPTAGAPLSDTINEFLHTCGINIVYGYGLTETTATVTCFDTVGYEIGTVGTVMPEVQVKIGENNEILVKGPTVMKGYYKKPLETQAVFTQDGWFRTGDAGNLSSTGALVLTERIKDLFKTSNGKYIAPQAIETKLGEDKYIDQVAVIGDQRKYVTAIIIPAFEALKEYAAQKQIQYRNLEELIKNQNIQKLIQERVNELQKNFARFEQIKKFTLLPRAFSMEAGELTNTLKIRRPIINKMYRAEIEAMYV
ncbi:AMP-dependent synthetase/ligase [Coprobacter tertius]|uniref:Long-chain fatty acid--CoA ligase n=1 Tax=Coprobacter tertius TaxID=2944915 RepID=A0ABT1MG63_9BACT|nr:long-chain fatty acid--CoA ligase [Coprobacter tertius]MCP9611615.1 long-chain fatty acid--CoA ligase [Coprobacter tertius]